LCQRVDVPVLDLAIRKIGNLGESEGTEMLRRSLNGVGSRVSAKSPSPDWAERYELRKDLAGGCSIPSDHPQPSAVFGTLDKVGKILIRLVRMSETNDRKATKVYS